MNQMIMTIYLWHMTALILIVGVALLLGGVGLSVQPSTSTWWSLRPMWLLFYLIALIPLALIFVRFESATKGGPDKTPGPWQSVPGAFVTCGGLIMMALTGVGANTALGVNWIAIALVLGGVFLATRRVV